MIFTGDSYIPGIKTSPNLPGGDKSLATESLELTKCLIKDRIVLPGHYCFLKYFFQFGYIFLEIEYGFSQG